ncbi:chromosome partitioning protein [Streptomyces broussonetiae]|uniref:Chromosome partitioning protein n=1 Tax=Streptomyces broussonetiae TaxID=2686304 RepID=A0A6I6MSX7_9ACTN|nr:chromosome partitioning protein [Streptomyces broussonetiae]QHA02094.1 chromosome partitioning protein [Streptomyces broussonetiae]
MTGIEIVVGYLCAWGVRKARRVGDRADEEVDRALDAGMDRLHDLVSQKLGEDTALQRLTEEAASGQSAPSDRTRQRVQLALEDAAEHDPAFAADLEYAVQHLRAMDRTAADHIEFQHNTFHGPVQVKGVQHNHPGATR